AKDRVTVVITPGPNVMPKADAGKDTTIALPSSSVNLDGSQSVDPDGIITFYQWRQVSGPGQATIFNPMSAKTAVGGLYPGEYRFELTVTDNRGGADKDSVLVSVVNNFRSEESLTIFPNPAISDISLRCVSDSLGLCQLNFYHMNGMLEKSVSFSKNQAFLQQQFQVSDLKAGMYLVEVLIAGKKRLTAKMIKQ
ncbi:MAG TPA: T9SS type A sorting domain-containing protein, partial [Chitinophagaceae bacterium]|nr:T9SS type A sorting domain-containing protein [Chitinophagaceae bacterium]